jgi:hypothetical protein
VADPPQVKQERSEAERKEMLVAAMAKLQAELSEIERNEEARQQQQQASAGADDGDDDRGSRGKKGSGGFLKVTRGKGTNSPALRLSSGEEVVDVVGGYAAAYAQHSGDFTHKETDEDYDDDDEGSYRGRAYNNGDNDDDEDDGKRQKQNAKGKETPTMERSDDLYESVDTSPERQDQATSMKVTGGAFVHSLYVQSADDYEGHGGNYDEDDDDEDERGSRRVVSAGGYLDHNKPFGQHSNDGQYFSYDEDDDEDEHEREEEREDDDDDDNDDDDESDAVHGQRVRNEHGYYEDAKEVNSLYLAEEDDGEAEDGDGKAIDAVYSSEHEVDSYPQDKVVDKRGRRKESSGGGLLRNFMRHSGEYRFRRRDGGGGSSAEKYFAGDGSVKGSRRRERDERKRKAKEEKREKKTEKKLKRMDRKLVTVGVPRRKSEREHESGIGASGEEGRHRWMRRAAGRVELRRSQPKSKDFLSDDDDRGGGGGDDVGGSDYEPVADDAAALGRTKISLRVTQPADAAGSDDEAGRKAPTSRMLAFRRKRRSMSEIEPGGRRGGKAQQPDHSAPAADGGGGGHMDQRTMTASGKVPGARRMLTGLGGSMEDVGSLSSHDRSVSASGVAATAGGEGRVKRAFERRVMEAKKRIGAGRSNKKNIERKASTGEAGAVVDVEAFLQENIGADWQEKMSQRDDVSSTVSPATVTSTAASGQHAALDNSPAAVAVAAAVASATAIESDSSPAVGRRQQLPVSPSLARRNAVGQLPDSIWNVRTFMRSTPHTLALRTNHQVSFCTPQRRFQELMSMPDTALKFRKLAQLAYDT